MENYCEFLNRINAFEKKKMELPNEDFLVNPSLKSKADEENRFKPFFGDTVVFDLDSDTKNKIENIVDALYKEAGECFCERLQRDTFHVTLHDLSNSTVLSEITEEMSNNELKVIKAVSNGLIKSEQIVMQSNNIFNMVGTSLVMGLKPKNESDYDKIMLLYSIINDVKPLSYPFTPHITLAYYNYFGFNSKCAEKLARVVNTLNTTPMQFTITTDKLYYQKFTDMNSYVNVCPLTNVFS